MKAEIFCADQSNPEQVAETTDMLALSIVKMAAEAKRPINTVIAENILENFCSIKSAGQCPQYAIDCIKLFIDAAVVIMRHQATMGKN